MNIPPPHRFIYSAGGPSGEVHRVDENTGGFGEKVEEIFIFEEKDIEKADKTRAALVSWLRIPLTTSADLTLLFGNRGMVRTQSNSLLICDTLSYLFLEPIQLRCTIMILRAAS